MVPRVPFLWTGRLVFPNDGAVGFTDGKNVFPIRCADENQTVIGFGGDGRTNNDANGKNGKSWSFHGWRLLDNQ